MLAAPGWRPLFARVPAVAAESLIVRQAMPLNAESALPALVQSWITPVDQFFVRTHAAMPKIKPEDYRLRIEGLVDKPLELSLEEMKDKFAAASTTATLTCAGNRRSEFTGGEIPGVQWQAGAIGNARWGGVRLADVLKAAGVKAEARHVSFDGRDIIRDKGESYCFGGSVPLEKVLTERAGDVGVLLASTMNDKPLTAAHGAPLRTITPGYIGARSVKWLDRIVVADKPSSNHYVADAYKLFTKETPAQIKQLDPLYEFIINSAIAAVKQDGTQNGKLIVHGYALASGKPTARIKDVGLSLDDGKTWQPARLEDPAADYCWQLWSAELDKPADARRILARAVDTTGAVQPRATLFNAKGYQYNGWHAASL